MYYFEFMNFLRSLIFRLRALFFIAVGIVLFIALPLSGLYWLLTGVFLPFRCFEISENLVDSI
jgi:hypothetical protein